MWFVGMGWHVLVSLVVDDVLFVLELMALLMVGVKLVVLELIAGAVGRLSLLGLVVMCGVLFTLVGIVGVVGWCGWVALLVDDGLFRVELVTVVVGWRCYVGCWRAGQVGADECSGAVVEDVLQDVGRRFARLIWLRFWGLRVAEWGAMVDVGCWSVWVVDER